MWIKICGNTNAKDPQLAATAGADAVGFVFAPSPRQVTPEQVAAIAPQLPDDLTRVGVFQTRDFDEIASTVRMAGLHGIQLHGGLDLSLIDKLRAEFSWRQFLIQAVSWQVDDDPMESEQQFLNELRAVVRHGVADALLIDAKTTTASGGTGKTLDWKHAREVLDSHPTPIRIVIAGGLHPGNVREAIVTLRPWGVDVSSGVEAAPGRKHPEILEDFIRAARFAFLEIEPDPMLPVEAPPV